MQILFGNALFALAHASLTTNVNVAFEVGNSNGGRLEQIHYLGGRTWALRRRNAAIICKFAAETLDGKTGRCDLLH